MLRYLFAMSSKETSGRRLATVRCRVKWYLTIIFAQIVWLAPAAHASTLGFFGITSNDVGDVAIGEAQLTVDVTDPGGNQVLFTFLNAGPAASSIVQVYFDDGSLLGIASIDDSDPGVEYSQDASPPDLPGGENATPPFEVTAGFLADADAGQGGKQLHGVNPGESLGILFDLQDEQTFNNVIAELASGELRIGIHVQGFDSGGSESFINNPVPLPAAVWLLGSALLALIGLRRRINGVRLD